MDCREAQTLMGAHLDGELPETESTELHAHIASCAVCAEELNQQEQIVATISAADPARQANAPAELWSAVQARLEGRQRASEVKPPGWLFRRPMALAASLALIVGAGSFIGILLTGSVEQAHASSIDYSILLDGLTGRVDVAIEKFLSYYDAKPIPAEQAQDAAPDLSYGVPPRLPADFELQQAYRLKFGDSRGAAAVYRRGDEPLVVFFHPTADDRHSGEYKEMSCIVGEHHGHQVQVGEWRLLHFMGETTCHCVLTSLDPNGDDLSRLVPLIAPDFATREADPNH